MGGTVDEVREGRQCGCQTNYGTIESRDKNLGVGIEGMGHVQVTRDILLQAVSPDVHSRISVAVDRYVCASILSSIKI